MRMIFLNMLNKPWPKFHILSKIIKQHFEVWYKNEWSSLCKKDRLKAFLFLIYKKVEFVDLKIKLEEKKYASSTPDPTFHNHFSLIFLWYKCTLYYQTLLHMGICSPPPALGINYGIKRRYWNERIKLYFTVSVVFPWKKYQEQCSIYGTTFMFLWDFIFLC